MEIGVLVSVNSRQARVEKLDDKNYRISVDAKAVEGKANLRLIQILADYFKVPKSSIRIVRGAKSRKKLIEVIT